MGDLIELKSSISRINLAHILLFNLLDFFYQFCIGQITRFGLIAMFEPEKHIADSFLVKLLALNSSLNLWL